VQHASEAEAIHVINQPNRGDLYLEKVRGEMGASLPRNHLQFHLAAVRRSGVHCTLSIGG